MGLISKLFRRGDNSATSNLKESIVFNAAQNEAVRGDNETDIAFKKDLSFKYEVIHDEDKEDILAQKCLKPTPTPAVDDKGQIQYVHDKKGALILDGNGEPIIQYVQGYVIDNNYAALRNMVSHTNRLTFLSPKNKRLLELLTEDIIEDVKTNNLESEFDLGNGAYLNSIFADEVLLLSDAENGNKVKAMLENRQIKTFDMTMGNKEKKGLF
jgi:hypothetical protein